MMRLHAQQVLLLAMTLACVRGRGGFGVSCTPQTKGQVEQRSQLWMAMGVIVGRSTPPFRRHLSGFEGIAWRYVTTRATHLADADRFVVVDCPDFLFTTNQTRVVKTEPGFQFSCFCKTAAWFERALTLFPNARFVGKMEDDSVLHSTRVVAELAAAHRVARREQAVRHPLLWYGHFDWSTHELFGPAKQPPGRHCGIGDDLMLRQAPSCNRGRGVMSPYASGGLDIRSRAIVELVAGCDGMRVYLSGFERLNVSYQLSCDGLQGYFMARCLAPYMREAATARPGATAATALHLPWPKFHPPSGRAGARMHTSIVHPEKRPCKASEPPGSTRHACDPAMSNWQWNEGRALLPFPFSLHLLSRANGEVGLGWEPWNRTAVRRYYKLHEKREDERYCDELPCGVPAKILGN